MKEIKFRVWNKNLAMPGSNEFIEYSDKIGLKKFFEIYPKQGVVLNGNAERFLMQYTGLKSSDVGGMPIQEAYFGDIVRFATTEGIVHIKEIRWNDEMNCIAFGDFDYPFLHESGYIQPSKVQFEIIGNIHQGNF